mmetsp:Transcript_141701/g.246989  ORF Transcript_141701/g.246989 Transcript_141701/m.246989 type:complete len:295 (-) Transcript_141701:56-940(-)
MQCAGAWHIHRLARALRRASPGVQDLHRVPSPVLDRKKLKGPWHAIQEDRPGVPSKNPVAEALHVKGGLRSRMGQLPGKVLVKADAPGLQEPPGRLGHGIPAALLRRVVVQAPGGGPLIERARMGGMEHGSARRLLIQPHAGRDVVVLLRETAGALVGGHVPAHQGRRLGEQLPYQQCAVVLSQVRGGEDNLGGQLVVVQDDMLDESHGLQTLVWDSQTLHTGDHRLRPEVYCQVLLHLLAVCGPPRTVHIDAVEEAPELTLNAWHLGEARQATQHQIGGLPAAGGSRGAERVA